MLYPLPVRIYVRLLGYSREVNVPRLNDSSETVWGRESPQWSEAPFRQGVYKNSVSLTISQGDNDHEAQSQ